MPNSFALPPVEYCLGTRPSHAANSRPLWKAAPLPIAAIIMVVDEVERRSIGRPWLTLVIDVATRVILGFYLSLDAPSSTSVASALSHAILPKRLSLESAAISGSWPAEGLPEMIHLDNAKEFHGNALKRGCREHGILLTYRPPQTPHFGATSNGSLAP
jgi:putative transposase